jgi:GH15 family glucan-1,4-alpha-glucosidase
MMDGSIWQYNLEWVRDQAMVIKSLVMLGDFETSRTMLTRLFTEFVTDDGDTIDSGKTRPVEEIELDQNGALLHALKTYVDWSGDRSIVKELWSKIRATAEFPLKQVFRHEPSGLMHNRREYWERHALHGIEDGMELTYQFFVSLGLKDTACLARLIGREEEAARWESEAKRIEQAMLHDEQYSMVENGAFIKRRGIGGEVQEEIRATPEAGLPDGIPLLGAGRHLLDPDTSSALPIAHEFIDPGSDLAAATLKGMEALRMEGGYSRYNVTSEPDSPGPWPFASLFIARACLEAGDHERAWQILNWLGRAPGANAGTWFEFYGPRPVPPYPQVGIAPWTWAEILCFFIHHLLGVRPSHDGLLIRPRLLTGMEKSEALLRIGEHKLHLLIRRMKEGEEPGFHAEGHHHPYNGNGCRLNSLSENQSVEAVVP